MVHFDCYEAINRRYKCCHQPDLQAFAYEFDESWGLYCSVAVPHWFDKDMLDWMHGHLIQNTTWQELIERSAIEPHLDRTYRMHDAAREHLWKSILVVAEGSLAWRWNCACAIYLAKCTNNADVLTRLAAIQETPGPPGNPGGEQDADFRQRASVELLYHLLLMDWICWLPVAYNEFEAARVNGNFNVCSIIRDYTVEVAGCTKRPTSIEMIYFDLAIDKLKGNIPITGLRKRQLVLQEAVTGLDMSIFHNRRLFQDISNLVESEGERT